MSQQDEVVTLTATGSRQYQIIVGTSLLVMTLPLLGRGVGVWAALPLVVGATTMLLKWRPGPYLVLCTFLLLILADATHVTPLDILLGCVSVCQGMAPRRAFDEGALTWNMEEGRLPLDLVLAAGLVGYLIGAFRLMSVQQNILPVDPRRRSRPARRRERQRSRRGRPIEINRFEDDVQPSESVTILITAVVVAVVAVVFGVWLERRDAVFDLATLQGEAFQIDVHPETWRLVVLLTVLGVVLLVTSGVLAYVGMTRLTPEEAQLYLQDQVWKETRREQSRINRWLAWARLKQRGRAPLSEGTGPQTGERG